MRPIAQFSGDVEKALLRGMSDGLQRLERRAIDKSSGPFTQRELDRMDNPYATRHAAPLLDPSTINVQTDAFRQDWHAQPVIYSGGVITVLLENRNPVADFLIHGTRDMVPRPIDKVLEAEAEEILTAALEAQLAKVLGETYS